MFSKSKRPVFVTHVKMMHGHLGENELRKDANKTKERIAISQFNVAKIILNNPGKAVVQEGLGSVFNKNHPLYSKRIENKIRKNFHPDDFKKEFSELSFKQKELLGEYEGAFVLFFLGQLSVIYPSMDERLAKYVKENVSGYLELELDEEEKKYKILEFENQVRQEREEQALDHTFFAARDMKTDEVLLIYGGIHDFTLHKKDKQFLILREPLETRENEVESKMGLDIDKDDIRAAIIAQRIKRNDQERQPITKLLSRTTRVDLTQPTPQGQQTHSRSARGKGQHLFQNSNTPSVLDILKGMNIQGAKFIVSAVIGEDTSTDKQVIKLKSDTMLHAIALVKLIEYVTKDSGHYIPISKDHEILLNKKQFQKLCKYVEFDYEKLIRLLPREEPKKEIDIKP